jgi:peptidoglycan/LPS O-acetylase OafA/YrhL
VSSRATVQPHATGFRSDIQGLRALAVLLVLVYHAGLPFLPGGFVGVDVFFVISGFLITSQLLKGIRTHGRVDLVDFYGRRARRILPAALLALVGTLALTLAILPRSRWDAIAFEATGSVLFVVNWVLGQGSTDYLRQDEAASPLQHFWSLAVEEQFYLLWPLTLILVLFLARRIVARRDTEGSGRRPARLDVTQRRLIVAAALLLFAGSLLYSMYLTTANPGMAYFATTTRIYELIVGVALALFATQLANIPRLPALVLGWAGLAAMVGAGVGFSGATVFPAAAALVPTLGAAAVIVSGMNGRQRAGVGALLSVRPVTWIGDISYSLYLWHWPLIVMATFVFDGLHWTVGLATVALSVLPAWASYRWVETPFQRWSFVRPPRRAIRVGLAASLVVVVGTVSLGVYTSRPTAQAAGWERPTYQNALERARSSTDTAPVGAELLQEDPEDALTPTPPDEILQAPENLADDQAENYTQGCVQGRKDTQALACTYGPDDAGFRVALVGDSHAAHVLPAVNRLAAENGWQVSSYTKTSCPFTAGRILLDDLEFTECGVWNQAMQDELKEQDFDLVLTSASAYKAPTGESVPTGYAAAWSAVEDAGTPVAVIIDPPQPGFNVPECLETNPGNPRECAYHRNDAEKTGARDQYTALEDATGADAIDLTTWICPDGTCAPVVGDVIVWRDTNHLTATFAESLAPMLGGVLHDRELIPALEH